MPRDDDIVISTSYKSGTTRMQNIMAQLLFFGQEEVPVAWDVSPWIDTRLNRPIEEAMATKVLTPDCKRWLELGRAAFR